MLTFKMREGSQSDGLKKLCSYVHERIGGNLTIVEIGVYCGESTEIFSSCFPGSTIHAVDIWEKYVEECSSYDMEKQGLELAEAEGIFDSKQFNNVVKHKMSSVEFAKQIKDSTCDLVYVDGNHQKASVIEDCTTWLPKIKPSRFLAGHDYMYPPVRKALGKLDIIANRVFQDSSWIKMKG